ncbi:hypothetical protein C8R44DRAFT_715989 [Mycena epipterygia]|nr:hypothetical protein C8R44DRAFT_715989 [Mycena epipterygia]
MPPARTLSWESDETRDYAYPQISPGELGDLLTPFPQATFTPTSSAEASRSPRTRHARKQPAGHIPRPPNAFILFRSSFIRSQRVPSAVEPSHSTLSKIIGLTWQHLPEAERRVWHAKADEAMEEHRRKFPTYAFRPQSRRPGAKGAAPKDKDATKRKTREYEAEDSARCEKIAKLLVEGKHGSALDAAVQDFDRDRVKFPVVTRFEPPITATAYRRSSSVPVEPEPGFLVTTSSRRRSSSSGPPCRSCNESDPPTMVQSDILDNAQTCAVDTFLSPSAMEPETPYFDFSTFSFSPASAGPAQTSPDFTCDPSGEFTCSPLWMGLDSSPTSSDFKFAAQPDLAHPHSMNVGASTADDWARAAPCAAYSSYAYDSSHSQYDSDSGSIAPSYFGGVQNMTSEQQAYFIPHVDADLALLMAQYSLDT